MASNVTTLAPRERPAAGALAMWSREQLDVIKQLICPGASDTELELFGQVCQRTGLDPFARQVYGIMRSQRMKQPDGSWKSVDRLSIQTSIDGFRLSAQRSGEYAGQAGPQWCDQDGVWRDVWLETHHPAAARVGVIRKGWSQPTWAVATWQEYAQTNDKGPVGMWKNMPANQLAKCAESLALRKVFPQELSGLYSKDEMAQAENVGPTIEDASVIQANAVGRWTGEQTAPVSHAADAETRARFEANWTKGVARAAACGAASDDKPGPEATKGALNAAQRELMEAIQTRETLNAAFTSKQTAVKALGVDTAEIDLAQTTDQDLHEMIGALDEMLSASQPTAVDGLPLDNDLPF